MIKPILFDLVVNTIRVITIFLGLACIVISLVEARSAALLNEKWAFMRWFGRFLMVLYIVVGAWLGIHHHRPITWITPIPPVAFLCLIIGYTHNYLDRTDSAERA